MNFQINAYLIFVSWIVAEDVMGVVKRSLALVNALRSKIAARPLIRADAIFKFSVMGTRTRNYYRQAWKYKFWKVFYYNFSD